MQSTINPHARKPGFEALASTVDAVSMDAVSKESEPPPGWDDLSKASGSPPGRGVQQRQMPHASGTDYGHAIQGDGTRLHLHMIPTKAITATTHHRRWSAEAPVDVSPAPGALGPMSTSVPSAETKADGTGGVNTSVAFISCDSGAAAGAAAGACMCSVRSGSRSQARR